MKILVTGATGMLGHDLCRMLADRGIPHAAAGSRDCDIRDPDAAEALVAREKPEAVIHCAAYTNVDRAESEPEACWAVNAEGTRNLALACRRHGGKLLYVSTDYVFPGTGETPYETGDPAGPLNAYGLSKLAGELAVMSLLDEYFIVRVSWLFGAAGNDFVKTMLCLAETRDTVGVVGDQTGSPTYTADLAPLLCDMAGTERYGVYHATNEGFCTWAEFAEEIFRRAGKPVGVTRLTTEEYPTPAARPRNSRLSKAALDGAGFARLPRWEDALGRYLREINACGGVP